TAPTGYELVFVPNESKDRGDALGPDIKKLAEQYGGRALPLEETPHAPSAGGAGLWINLPLDQYDRFKSGLASLGTIQSERRAAPPPSPSPESAGAAAGKTTARALVPEPSPSINIKLILQKPEKPQ
ncbi:MAG TPA: hypothetical protein VI382_01425, partial [Candidatus Manganitrophaceae bacterium]|nr:hypothetical protein [Candidatus Manganitrophaceae bacterium]